MRDLYTLEERYLHDPVFSQLVQLLEACLRQAEITPTEVREALMFAMMRVDDHRITRFLYPQTKDYFDQHS